MLPGTEGANLPFWSPDSRLIGFFAGGKLKKIDVTGSPAITLCDSSEPRGGSWSREDVIIFAKFPEGLFRVPAAGGAPAPLTRVDTTTGEAVHHAPWFLPDGRRFLYTASHDDTQNARIYLDSIDTTPSANTRKEVLAATSNAAYAGFRRTGWLLFIRENTLMAQPFDARSAKTTGEAGPVAEKFDYDGAFEMGLFSGSAEGTLVYLSGAWAMPLSNSPGSTVRASPWARWDRQRT